MSETHSEVVRLHITGADADEGSTAVLAKLGRAKVPTEVQRPRSTFDGFNLEAATIVVACTGALSAVISALLAHLAQRKDGVITIVGKSGRKLIVPKDTSQEELTSLLAAAKKIDIDHLEITDG